ncbi:MAG: type II toxin-antitoxin system HicB family antitoxin [Armatimonadota bacterium]|nr:type II toxin-antitoxin system HicB family antitoxin [bacterium]
MKQFTVVIEKDPSGKFTLTVPALPGYVACGDSEDEVLQLAQEGIPFHLSCLAEEGIEPPHEGGEAKVVSLNIAA